MKKQLFLTLIIMIIIVIFFPSSFLFAKEYENAARTLEPLVSTDWLDQNSGLEKLVIIDVRPGDAYAVGHIPNSISVPFVVPFCAWLTMRGDLLLEMPDEASLFSAIGACGIAKDSLVVVVTTLDPPPAPPYSLASATRVALTLIYAGLKNVAILDGGFLKWEAEGKAVTTAYPAVTPVTFKGKIDKELLASVDYVERHLQKAIIIDARDADVYFGVTIEPWASKAGHIPGARSLPAPWMWNADGTYKPTEMLNEMASGVIEKSLPTCWVWNRGKMEMNNELLNEFARGVAGQCKDKEIIVYCGVGGYGSSWWFVLTQMLGYKNVKFFDGSAQEWVKTNDMVKYTWTH